MLAEKGIYPPFPNAPRQDQNNPLVCLPSSIDNIIQNIYAVIVTHLYIDHWDDAAKKALPKDIKMFVQNEKDAVEIQSNNFQNVEVLREDTVLPNIMVFC